MDQDLLHDRLREALVYLEYEDLRFLAQYDLDTAEYSTLRILNTTSGLRMGDLRERLLLDKSKVTRIVDHLVEHGWVLRAADPDDRRALRVMLTPGGHAHLSHVTADRAQTLPSRFEALSSADQAELGRLLVTLRDHLADRLNPI